MTPAQAVEQLDAIGSGDAEGAHGEADSVLLAVVPEEVSAAYARVMARQEWWASA